MNLSEEAIAEISSELMEKNAVYFNFSTTDIFSIPEFREDYAPRDYQEEQERLEAERPQLIRLIPMGDDELYGIMKEFTARQVTDGHLQARLYRTLDQRRPFANFEHVVYDSEYKEEWQAHLEEKNLAYTQRILLAALAELGIEVNMASREVILYIAASLDGFIARADGSLDWLPQAPEGEDFGYAEFLSGIGVTLMGNKTFQQVAAFEGEFPYMDKENYVFSRSKVEIPEGIPATVINENPADFVRELRAKSGPDIWLIGGGEINALLLQEGLIDRLKLFVIPVALGRGVPLFGSGELDARFRLIENRTYPRGTVELEFKLRKEVPVPEASPETEGEEEDEDESVEE